MFKYLLPRGSPVPQRLILLEVPPQAYQLLQRLLIRNREIKAYRYPCCRLISDSKILIRLNCVFILSNEFKAYAAHSLIEVRQRSGHFENKRALGNNCRRITAQLGKPCRIGKRFAKTVEFWAETLPLTFRS